MIIPEIWKDVDGLFCGFGSRQVPSPSPEEMRARGVSAVVTVTQVHGRDLVTANDVRVHEAVRADGVVVDAAGLLAAVRTADCVPILMLSTSDRRPIWAAAVHAGWRGTAAAITDAAVEKARQRGIAPASIEVVLGPAIGGCCYEVGEEVLRSLRPLDVLRAGTLIDDRGVPKVDLRRVNAVLLERAGVRPDAIRMVGPCTRCASARYFSFRRHPSESGRQLSWIGWADRAQ